MTTDVTPDAVALAASIQTPTTAFDYAMAVGSVLALAASVETPTPTFDFLHEVASALGMTCEIQDPTAIISGRVFIVCSSTDPAILDINVGGVLIARFTA